MPSLSQIDLLSVIGARFFAFNLARYAVFAGVLSAVVWLLRRSPWQFRTIQSRSATLADRLRELRLSLGSLLVYAVVGAAIVWGQRAGLIRQSWGYGRLGNLALLAAMIVAHDAWFYWIHRAMHHPRLFRLFHRAHHRSITPTPWAAYAFAVPEAVIEVLFLPVWLMLVPTPSRVAVAWLLFQLARNVMIHAGFELMPRWWLATPLTRWITATTHHDLHHAGRFDCNYGLYFTWWDQWMGTEHPDYAAKFAEVVNRRARGAYPVSPAAPASPAAAG